MAPSWRKGKYFTVTSVTADGSVEAVRYASYQLLATAADPIKLREQIDEVSTDLATVESTSTATDG